jgi:hypothetical protein
MKIWHNNFFKKSPEKPPQLEYKTTKFVAIYVRNIIFSLKTVDLIVVENNFAKIPDSSPIYSL